MLVDETIDEEQSSKSIAWFLVWRMQKGVNDIDDHGTNTYHNQRLDRFAKILDHEIPRHNFPNGQNGNQGDEHDDAAKDVRKNIFWIHR